MNDGELKVHTDSPDSTRAVGAALARGLLASASDPIVIALIGELGAGKTTLVSGLMTAVGVSGPIRSPTYTLVEPYEIGTRTLYHLDLYRLGDARELEMLALRDLLAPGNVLLIEWAERAVGVLPTPDMTLRLSYLDGNNTANRIISIEASTSIGKGLAKGLQALTDKTGVSS